MAPALVLVTERGRHIVLLEVTKLLFELIQFIRETLQLQLRKHMVFTRHGNLLIQFPVSLRFTADLQVKQVHFVLHGLVLHISVELVKSNWVLYVIFDVVF